MSRLGHRTIPLLSLAYHTMFGQSSGQFLLRQVQGPCYFLRWEESTTGSDGPKSRHYRRQTSRSPFGIQRGPPRSRSRPCLSVSERDDLDQLDRILKGLPSPSGPPQRPPPAAASRPNGLRLRSRIRIDFDLDNCSLQAPTRCRLSPDRRPFAPSPHHPISSHLPRCCDCDWYFLLRNNLFACP